MNYKKLHDRFINYCLNTSPRERLERRSPNDERLLEDWLYTEKHHIIPRHDGGKDEDSNYVVLLPEEHYMIHLIRYYAFGQRGDFLSVRFVVNGIKGRSENIGKSVYRNVKTWKHRIQKFRKENSWHTQEGVKNIAKAQSGWFNAKDKNGDIIRVKVDDERVLNGELKHHTSGTRNVKIKKTGEIIRVPIDEFDPKIHESPVCMKGKNNPNYREFTDEHHKRFINCIKKSADSEGIVFRKHLSKEIKLEFTEFKRVSLIWFENNLVLEEECKKHGFTLFKHDMKMPKSIKNKISKSLKETNNQEK